MLFCQILWPIAFTQGTLVFNNKGRLTKIWTEPFKQKLTSKNLLQNCLLLVHCGPSWATPSAGCTSCRKRTGVAVCRGTQSSCSSSSPPISCCCWSPWRGSTSGPSRSPCWQRQSTGQTCRDRSASRTGEPANRRSRNWSCVLIYI